jgi:hypothetical protein
MISQRVLIRTGALPDEPTDALPGTEEKVLAMIQRAARRQQLFHPLDGLACRFRACSEAISPPSPEPLIISPFEPASEAHANGISYEATNNVKSAPVVMGDA